MYNTYVQCILCARMDVIHLLCSFCFPLHYRYGYHYWSTTISITENKYFLKTCGQPYNVFSFFGKWPNKNYIRTFYFHKYEKRPNVHKDTIYLTDVTDVKSTITYCTCCWLFCWSRRTNNERFERRNER